MVLGALAVVSTYLLRAVLLVTVPQHIVNAHAAWQNSASPLYSTLCCCLWRECCAGRTCQRAAGSPRALPAYGPGRRVMAWPARRAPAMLC